MPYTTVSPGVGADYVVLMFTVGSCSGDLEASRAPLSAA